MKFTNIVYDMIVEEVKNKSLINSLLAKWQVENNSLTYQDVEGIYENYFYIIIFLSFGMN